MSTVSLCPKGPVAIFFASGENAVIKGHCPDTVAGRVENSSESRSPTIASPLDVPKIMCLLSRETFGFEIWRSNRAKVWVDKLQRIPFLSGSPVCISRELLFGINVVLIICFLKLKGTLESVSVNEKASLWREV